MPDREAKGLKGTFDLDFSARGHGGLETIVGEGRVLIDSEDPAAHTFPVVDGLVGFLEGLLPRLKKNGAWTLDLPFSVKGGALTANEAKLNGPSIKATVNGKVDLITEEVDVGVGVNLRGLVGVAADLLTLFSKNVVDVTGKGKLGEVEWKMGNGSGGK